MHRGRLFTALVITSLAIGSADARVRGDQEFHQLSQAELSQLQQELTSALGTLREGDQGTRPLSELTVQVDGPTVIPIEIDTAPRDGLQPAVGAPLCFNVLIVPNRLPAGSGWLLTFNTIQGFWNPPPKIGPLYTFNVGIPPQTYFWWFFGWTGCANSINTTYRWTMGAEFWLVWHRMVANVGIAGYNYPLVGPRWTLAAQGRSDAIQGTNGSLGVSNAGAAFCDAPYDLETGACSGSSIPAEDVTIEYAGYFGPEDRTEAVPAAGPIGIAALGVLFGVTVLLILRKRRTNAS